MGRSPASSTDSARHCGGADIRTRWCDAESIGGAADGSVKATAPATTDASIFVGVGIYRESSNLPISNRYSSSQNCRQSFAIAKLASYDALDSELKALLDGNGGAPHAARDDSLDDELKTLLGSDCGEPRAARCDALDSLLNEMLDTG